MITYPKRRTYGGRGGSRALRARSGGLPAVVMEGVTVGQVFDAECILSKRPRKVSDAPAARPRGPGLRSGGPALTARVSLRRGRRSIW